MALLSISRSAFLRLCGSALVGAGVDVRVAEALMADGRSAIHRMSGGFDLKDATASAFLPHVHTVFRLISASGDRVRVTLAEVAERPVSRNVAQFSLIFHAPRGRALPDGIHAFEHPSLGAFDLFVTRVGAGKRRTVYQACFSRLVRT
jgi:hypothetical protein